MLHLLSCMGGRQFCLLGIWLLVHSAWSFTHIQSELSIAYSISYFFPKLTYPTSGWISFSSGNTIILKLFCLGKLVYCVVKTSKAFQLQTEPFWFPPVVWSLVTLNDPHTPTRQVFRQSPSPIRNHLLDFGKIILNMMNNNWTPVELHNRS